MQSAYCTNLHLNIYIAEIYEQKREIRKSVDYLTAFLNESNRLQKMENDRELRMMLAELDSYIKYRRVKSCVSTSLSRLASPGCGGTPT